MHVGTGFDYKTNRKTTLVKLETRVIHRSSLLYSLIYAVSKYMVLLFLQC